MEKIEWTISYLSVFLAVQLRLNAHPACYPPAVVKYKSYISWHGLKSVLTTYICCRPNIFDPYRRYMAEILPMRRKTLSNQSISLWPLWIKDANLGTVNVPKTWKIPLIFWSHCLRLRLNFWSFKKCMLIINWPWSLDLVAGKILNLVKCMPLEQEMTLIGGKVT